jgi:prepilin-type N-terminal cleavage/methylation domain-containing protein
MKDGFSLIEVIIVVALIAFVYSVAIPQLGQVTGSEVASKINQLASDVRNAYDLSVLTKKTYRLTFNLATGDYRLEESDREDIYLGNEKLDRDPTETEEKDAVVAFDMKFKDYEDLAGQVVVDQENDKEIPPTSPVIEAKGKLKPATWTPVENMEWAARTLGPNLMIKDMQSEHHGHKQDFTELGREARGMIYFFPNGYVQRAVIHIAYAKDEMTPDDSKEPYTITTNPYEGTAETANGYVEIDVHRDPEN